MKTYILDGYNVIHAIPRFEQKLDVSLQAAREALIRECIALRTSRGDIGGIFIVFDGKDEFAGLGPSGTAGVVTVFTHSREEADERIVAILDESCRCRQSVIIVSNDNYVQNHARAFGQSCLRAQEFFNLFTKKQSMPKNISISNAKHGLSSHAESEITAEYRKYLGI
jgi:predicted RNA-binding protein with PIN domain